jgi:hypothetical protein
MEKYEPYRNVDDDMNYNKINTITEGLSSNGGKSSNTKSILRKGKLT